MSLTTSIFSSALWLRPDSSGDGIGMICDSEMTSRAAECLARLRRRSTTMRIATSGAFDLTYRCNLRCVHCYVAHLHAQSARVAGELSTEGVLRLVREAAEAGCLFLLLSGGEPLLRKDFSTIYAECRRLGIVVTVFTNATLLTQGHVSLFGEYPPQQVEVSVYGATQETYERVSQVAGSYAQAVRGIEMLVATGVHTRLKTMILRQNVHEVPAMQAWAARLGVKFRVDPLVIPRLDGGREPLRVRVAPEVAAPLEVNSPVQWQQARDYASRPQDTAERARVYRCAAGVTNFHLDPKGALRPCLTSRSISADAVSVGFEAAWRAVVSEVDGLTGNAERVCAGCPRLALCGYCPGLFELETGDVERPSEYVCALGEHRAHVLGLENQRER
jgi:radical SAM protein with 4Fe4S-binding SPASM domain